MDAPIIKEPTRILFYLNGYTKVLLERTEGKGLADGGITWDISTEIIPVHLRKISSRFVIHSIPLCDQEMNDIDAIRNTGNRIEIRELDE